MARLKMKSRSARRDEAVGQLDTTLGKLSDLQERIKTFDIIDAIQPEQPTDEERGRWRAEHSICVDELENVKLEFESLQEEMQNWADSMPENLQSGDRYDRITSAAESMSNAASNLDDAIMDKIDFGNVDISGIVGDLEECTNNIEQAKSDAEEAEFPGMMG